MQVKNFKAISHSIPCSKVGEKVTMKAKNAATPLCYVEAEDGKPLGHIWQGTTSTKVRKCSRCHLVQFKTSTGHWKNARSLKDAKTSIRNAVEQADMWALLEEGEN